MCGDGRARLTRGRGQRGDSTAYECLASRVNGRRPQALLDAEQLVVLLDALATTRRTGLAMAGAEGDGQVGDEAIDGLTAAVGHHRTLVQSVHVLNGLSDIDIHVLDGGTDPLPP